MAVVFHIPGYLRPFTQGQKRVQIEVSRRVVRDALDGLARKYPGVGDRVLTETGEVRAHVNVFVGTESIRYTGGLDTPIGEREEVTIVPAVSGGSGHQFRTSSV
jgi:sulfur-carrier protein